MEKLVKQKPNLIDYDNKKGREDFGNHYIIKNGKNELKEVWIGLLSLEDCIKQKFPYIYRDQTLKEIATDNDFFIWFGFYDDDSSYFFKDPNNKDYYAVPWNDGKPGKDYFFPIKIETDKGTTPNFPYDKINQEKFNELLDDAINDAIIKVLNHIDFKNKVKKTK